MNTRLDILKKRSNDLGEYVENKSESEEITADKLKKIAQMGTQRIINELSSFLVDLEKTNDTNDGISIELSQIKRQTNIGLNDTLTDFNNILTSIKTKEIKEFLKEYALLNKKLQSFFTFIENSEKIAKKEFEKNNKNKSVEKLLNVLSKSGKVIKNALKEISKIILISAMSTSIATANVNDVLVLIKDATLSSVEKIVDFESLKREDPRILFEKIKNNPQNIKLIPKFDERLSILASQLEKSELFSSEIYIKGFTWKDWNIEVTKILFPTVQDITLEESMIVVKALQQTLNLSTKEGMFGLSTKKELLKKTPNNDKEILKNLDLPSEPLKKITIEEFEENLIQKEGTKYISGKSDCSNIFLGIINDFEIIQKGFNLKHKKTLSSTLMLSLTKNRRNGLLAQKGDFIHWKSSKYIGAEHMAYLISVEEDGFFIFENSVDVGYATTRLITWKELKRKKNFIAGTPKFFA